MPNLKLIKKIQDRSSVVEATPDKLLPPRLKNPLAIASVEGVRHTSEAMKEVLQRLEAFLMAKPSARFDTAGALRGALADLGARSIEAAAEISAVMRGEL